MRAVLVTGLVTLGVLVAPHDAYADEDAGESIGLTEMSDVVVRRVHTALSACNADPEFVLLHVRGDGSYRAYVPTDIESDRCVGVHLEAAPPLPRRPGSPMTVEFRRPGPGQSILDLEPEARVTDTAVADRALRSFENRPVTKPSLSECRTTLAQAQKKARESDEKNVYAPDVIRALLCVGEPTKAFRAWMSVDWHRGGDVQPGELRPPVVGEMLAVRIHTARGDFEKAADAAEQVAKLSWLDGLRIYAELLRSLDESALPATIVAHLERRLDADDDSNKLSRWARREAIESIVAVLGVLRPAEPRIYETVAALVEADGHRPTWLERRVAALALTTAAMLHDDPARHDARIEDLLAGDGEEIAAARERAADLLPASIRPAEEEPETRAARPDAGRSDAAHATATSPAPGDDELPLLLVGGVLLAAVALFLVVLALRSERDSGD